MEKYDINFFIMESNKRHNKKYDYSLVNYVNSKTKVKIICPEHGEFEQLAKSHLKGCGCAKCGGIRASKKRLVNVENFIEKSNKIHLNKYNYSKTISANSSIKAIIICPEHGEFEQRVHDHLKGSGCPSCGGVKKLTQETFINRSLNIHSNKYSYDRTTYKTYEEKVIITCPIHGDFKQKPHLHLGGSGCQNCLKSKGEQKIEKYLLEQKIKFIPQQRFDDCIDTIQLPFDFYLPEHNICIEFDGRQHYEVIEKWGGIEGLKDRQKKDKIKNKYCLDNNISIIRIKYNENIINKLNKIQ